MPPGATAVLAEKPSVARDLARILGATQKAEGYLHGNGYIVTWAIGHLAALAQPHEIRPEWKSWRRDLLPMLPAAWPLTVYPKTQPQFLTVQKILTSPKISRIICATDAGREGELIFRYIYEAAHATHPVLRLWISSLTSEAIRHGLDTLKPSRDYDPLADAARGRSRADWLVGMNLSRAYTLAYGEELSVGRVQTPTLAMLVDRELAIRDFQPEDYFEVQATFRPTANPTAQSYKGTYFHQKPENTRLPKDGQEAAQIAARAKTGQAAIESIKAETQRQAPPLLYDLTELQRHANRLFGFSAQKTLDLAQTLYERHKLISYPRTDSRHLSKDVATALPKIVQTIAEPYRAHLAPGTGERPLTKRFVDDAKVTDHHAIIPTPTSPAHAKLTADESKIYDLICRRLLSAWHNDHIWLVTTVITAISSLLQNEPNTAPVAAPVKDRFHSSGTAVQQPGWKVLDLAPARASATTRKPQDDAGPQILPPNLEANQPQDVLAADPLKKSTRAPKRFTEGALLTAMETAGKTLDEKELSDAMKESGLGTPATRASIIEVLLKREYILRNGKNLEATPKGIRLIEVVHPEVKSPIMTGQWEAYLKRIERGQAQLPPFLAGIEKYVTEVVGKVGLEPAAAAPLPEPQNAVLPNEPKVIPLKSQESPQFMHFSPTPQPADLEQILHKSFGFPTFRANQQAVCQAVIEGNDVLLVMPTGAGKSLCYQLPGIVRGGVTLVISPLIALMEDQVAKLKSLGFAVERIHSARDRASSRQACIDYLQGNLQFLFIAPERLRVTGFPEMLAKRKPNLIAIDEAHCISQWGHDFRPDYRMFGNYLPSLRPAPVIALTATATPVVQRDIANQLGLGEPDRFIHGFRRSNIGIEVVETLPSKRTQLVCELLADPDRRPAIVYVPTRKQCAAVATELASMLPAAAYHAGLDAEKRKRVQQGFLSGQLDVIVATIAFGMGIDKPDVRTVIHTALPGSIEAYYQEIGRAGRDGEPSRAILMHSYADRYTHDFFFERDYPDVKVLDTIFQRLSPEPQPKEALQNRMGVDYDTFDKALEKLWIHGGAMVDFAENITIGEGNWRQSYVAHSEQRRAQIDLILRYAEANTCRMCVLIRHFGDVADSQRPCGICDYCAPADCVAQAFRPPTPREAKLAFEIAEVLSGAENRATGRLYAELCPRGEPTRDEFEELLAAMARAGYLKLTDAVFEKDGREIPYRKANLTRDGEEIEESTQVDLLIREVQIPKKKATAKSKSEKRTRQAEPKPAAKMKNEPGKLSAASDAVLETKLRNWRLAEAKRRGVPAFRIFTDATLRALAEQRPSTANELLAIPGIGMATVEKIGAQLYRLLHEGGPK